MRSVSPALFLSMLLFIVLPDAALAGKEGEAILQRAFAYEEAKAERFRPYAVTREGHMRVTDGDDELQHERRMWKSFIKWSPDSTEVLDEGEEVLFELEEEEAEEEEAVSEEPGAGDGEQGEEEEGKEDFRSLKFDFLQSHRRDSYKYRFRELESRDGRQVARFELKPRKKKKDLWKGHIWLDAESGALVSMDIEPAKKRFGLKKMQCKGDYLDFEGMNLTRKSEMLIEVKVPFLVHMKMLTVMDMKDHALVEP